MSVAPTCTWPIYSPERTYRRFYLRLELNLKASTPPRSSLCPHLHSEKYATEDDEILQALKAIILSGWPDDRSQLPEQTTPSVSERLCTD